MTHKHNWQLANYYKQQGFSVKGGWQTLRQALAVFVCSCGVGKEVEIKWE